MIEAKCNKGICEISMSGNLSELSADTITIVHLVFKSIFDSNTLSAMLFRNYIEENIDHAFIMCDEDKEDVE